MSNGFSFGDFRSRLSDALSRIGKRNGLTPPNNGSNIDPLMHELLVAADGEAHFKKRREQALKEVMKVLDLDELDAAITRVTKTDSGEELIMLKGDAYMLNLKLNRPSNRFDQTMLRNKLMRLDGFTHEQVEQLMESCTKKSAPSKRFTVIGR